MTVSITGDGAVTSTSGVMDFSEVIRMDSRTMSGSVTIEANRNAGQFGPVTITGSLTVPANSSYHVL
jgi:hypothetical protein